MEQNLVQTLMMPILDFVGTITRVLDEMYIADLTRLVSESSEYTDSVSFSLVGNQTELNSEITRELTVDSLGIWESPTVVSSGFGITDISLTSNSNDGSIGLFPEEVEP